MTSPAAPSAVPAHHCPKCGTSVAPGLLRCPACGALVFSDQLAKLAAAAEQSTAAGKLAEATHGWQEALHLLPADASQRAAINAKLEALGRRMERGEGVQEKAPSFTLGRGGIFAGIAAAGLFLLIKGKLLLLGLMKAGALLSMFAFLGIYWREWGWTLAVGILVSIYLHELGHMIALRRYGIPVSAPMFIPGVGAYVRHGVLPTDRIGARVALAGPAAGLVAAALAYGAFLVTGKGYWSAIAHLGALINLGNLIPVWQLDGVRGISSLALPGRIGFAVLMVAAGVVARDPMAIVIAIAAVAGVVMQGKPRSAGDRGAAIYAAVVIIGLGSLLTLAR